MRRFVELVILGIGKILIKISTVRKIIFWWMKFEKMGKGMVGGRLAPTPGIHGDFG